MGLPHTTRTDVDPPPHDDSRGLPWRLNATAPTAGAHGYAPAQLFGQNAFGTLATTNDSDTEFVDGSVATQMAALTYQSQLTANMAANTTIRQEQQLAHLVAQQEMMHQNMHQLIARMNAVTFNQSDEGRGVGHYAPRGYKRGSGGRFCTRGGQYQQGHGCDSLFLVFIPQGFSTQASVGFQDSHMALLTPHAFWRIAPPKETCYHIAHQYKQVLFLALLPLQWCRCLPIRTLSNTSLIGMNVILADLTWKTGMLV
jgi:hypothetical protein